MAADALGVMDALGVSRADVLGISLGGRIALELALGHPERVERLILVSTSARVVPSWRRRHLYPTLSVMPLFRSRYPQPRYAFVRQMEASRLQTFTGGHLFFLIRDRQRFVDAVATFIGQG